MFAQRPIVLAGLLVLAPTAIVLSGCTPSKSTGPPDDRANASKAVLTSPAVEAAAGAAEPPAPPTEPTTADVGRLSSPPEGANTGDPSVDRRTTAAQGPPTAPVALPGGTRLEQPRGGVPALAASAVEANPGQATVDYTVPTITCPSCAARIRANAKKDPGVVDVAVELETQRVTVVYDPAQTDPEKIAEAIRQGGDTVLPGE